MPISLVARHAGDLDGGLVDVGDLAVRADGDERVEAGLDQAAGVLRGLLLRRHVAGGGEDAEHVAASVLVDRGVVENVGELAVPVADGERIVGDEALLEDLLVALARLLAAR